MQLWVTVVDVIGRRPPVEALVHAPRGARFGDLRGRLAALTAGLSEPSWYVGADPLSDTTEIGAPPLLDGAVLCLGGPGTVNDDASPGLLRLETTGGPDAGGSWPLRSGRHVVGRAPGVEVSIDDPDLSRAHLEVDVTAAGTTVADLGTTNGTLVDQDPLGPAHRVWTMGQRVRVGQSTFELRTHGLPSAATVLDGQGHLLVNRPPRVARATAPARVSFPTPPEGRPRGGFPFVAMLVPLLVAVPIAWLQHSPAYLLFGLMSPAMLLGTFLGDRRGGRRADRRGRAAFEADRAAARLELAEAVAAEMLERRAAAPDLAELATAAAAPLARLWERRPQDDDFLTLRLGTGPRRAQVGLVGPTAPPAPVLPDVPVVLDLRAAGVLGIAGSTRASRRSAAAIVAQLTGWHSPRHLRVVLLTADAGGLGDWAWATRLPHARSEPGDCGVGPVGSLDRSDQVRRRVAELTAVLDERLDAQRGDPRAGRLDPSIVVVLDGARRLRSTSGVARLLELGPTVGMYAVCLDERVTALPTECTAVIEVSIRDAVRGHSSYFVAPDESGGPVTLDGVSPAWCDRYARSLARLRDATPDDAGRQLPDTARLCDLLEVDATDPQALGDHWRSSVALRPAVIGATGEGRFTVDLPFDGPHVLVGGTTGAGKSELLQALVASVAVGSSPERLAFVLIDYKGGAAFAQCAELPHTVGLVTDLDPHLADRALVSLDAELKRRERALAAVGAKDLDDYVRRSGPGRPPLPRLVIVIDEFRMLAAELPAFLDGVVRIGAVGRSLGVHLILATQRPAGVVSADIAANVNLRIALRVRDPADSEDVIESPAAAVISARTPGRAFARSASNSLVAFQTARVAGPVRRGAVPVLVEPFRITDLGDPRPPFDAGGPDQAETDLGAIVRACCAAARLLDLPASRRPWLPPLPERLTLDDLGTPSGPVAPYAVVDRPDQQTQQALAWDLATDGHLLVVGTQRSGRTTCLRTLAGSLAGQLSPAQVHLHAVDGGTGGLRSLAVLPQAGVIATVDQVQRSTRLLDRLADEVAVRQSSFGAAGFASLAEQWSSVDPDGRLPYLALMLDGFESLAAAWEQVDHGRPLEVLTGLMRDGAAVGLRVVITGDRGLLLSRLAAVVREKVILRLADPSDLLLAGVAASAVPRHQGPGRGVRVADQTEVQVALLTADPSGPAQIAALERIAAQARIAWPDSRPGPRPIRIEPLPARVDYWGLAPRRESASGQVTIDSVTVGLGGDAAEPVGLDLIGGSALVAGPPRSGRSTTLATVARSLVGAGRSVVAVTCSRSSLTDLTGEVGIEVLDQHELLRLQHLLDAPAEGGSGVDAVLVDDVERLLDSEAEDVVLQWFKGIGPWGGQLVVAGSTVELGTMFRGLSVVARRSGQGLLLNPSSYTDGDLLGVRVSPAPELAAHPGRGVLVRDGQVIPVQVAH